MRTAHRRRASCAPSASSSVPRSLEPLEGFASFFTFPISKKLVLHSLIWFLRTVDSLEIAEAAATLTLQQNAGWRKGSQELLG